MTDTAVESAHVRGEPLLQQAARALIGWLDDEEGVRFLLGRVPKPTDDIAPLQELIAKRRAAVAARETYAPVNPLIDPASQSGLDVVAARPEVQATFQPHRWRVALANLEHVLAFQKTIKTEDLDRRLAPVVEDADKLLELCLPTEQPAPPQGAFGDADGKGFTISSQNPNLRIVGGQLHEADVSAGPGGSSMTMQAITLLVNFGTSYLQVAHYNGRYFLRDGYHRAAGLIRAGITVVPCIFIDARSFEEVNPGQGMFTYETMFGPRPPRLIDFWDDEVASDIKQPAIRKVIRVRGEEFVVAG